MPQRSVYIREEDDEKWQTLKKKSEFIHNALQNNIGTDKPSIQTIDLSPRNAPSNTLSHSTKLIKTPKQAKEAVENTGFIEKSFSARRKK